MKFIEWWLALTPHQLDVIRTFASVVTAVFGGVLIPLVGVAIRGIRAAKREAEAAKNQTAHTEHIDGIRVSVPVVEYARSAAYSGAEAATSSESSAQATRDLAIWVKGNGVHREPTIDIPRQDSRYE